LTKILFINVINELRNRNMEITFSSLGTSYLASYLRKYGGFNDIEILDVGQSFDVGKFDVDVVGISSITQHFNIAKEITEKIKRGSNSLVLVGGHHITGLPNSLCENMDVAVMGEGEQTVLEIMQAYEKNHLNLSTINGVAYWEGGNLKFTSKREQIKPLDKIPFPARDLMHIGPHRVHMFTSRGCPYQCVFCSSAFFWKTVRFHSAKYVVAEICDIIEKYKPMCINFSDDLFIANKLRLRKISRMIRERGIHREVEFRCTARANLINNEVATLLKAMNLRTATMGLESGSNRILQYLKGNSVTVEQNEKAVKILKKHDLLVSATLVIGSPTETKEEMLQTYRLIERTELDGGDTYVLVPFPGTKVWEYAEKAGKVSDNMDWSRFDMYFEDHPNHVMLNEVLTRKELLEMVFKFNWLWKKRRYATLFKEAVKHPARILPFIKRKCGF